MFDAIHRESAGVAFRNVWNGSKIVWSLLLHLSIGSLWGVVVLIAALLVTIVALILAIVVISVVHVEE